MVVCGGGIAILVLYRLCAPRIEEIIVNWSYIIVKQDDVVVKVMDWKNVKVLKIGNPRSRTIKKLHIQADLIYGETFMKWLPTLRKDINRDFGRTVK